MTGSRDWRSLCDRALRERRDRTSGHRLSIVLVITSLLLILLVLLHKGRGGGLSDMFGGGVSAASAAPRWPSGTSTASRSASA